MDPESYISPPPSTSPPPLDTRPSLSYAPRPRLLPLPSVSPLPSPTSPRPPSIDANSRRVIYTARRTMDYPMTSFAFLSSQNSPANLDGRSDLPLGPEHEAIILTGQAENPNTSVPGSDTASTTTVPVSPIPMEGTTSTTAAPLRRRLVRRPGVMAERPQVVDLTGPDNAPQLLQRLPRQISPQSPRMSAPPSVALRHLYDRPPLFAEPTMVDDPTTSIGRSVAAREAAGSTGGGPATHLLNFVSAIERDLQVLRQSITQHRPSDPALLNTIVTNAGQLRLAALDQRHARTVDSAVAPRRGVLSRNGSYHPGPWNNNVRTAIPDSRRSSALSSISTMSFPSVTNLPTPPLTGASGLLFTEPASYEPGSASIPDRRGSGMNIDPLPNYRITRHLDEDGQEVVRTIPQSNLQWIEDDNARWVSEPSVMMVDGPAPPRVRRIRVPNPPRDSQNPGLRGAPSLIDDGIPMELAGLDPNGNEVQLTEDERRRMQRLRSLFYDSSLMTTTSTSIIPDDMQHLEPTLRVRIAGSGPIAATSMARQSPPVPPVPVARPRSPQNSPFEYFPCPLPIPVDEMVPRPNNKRKRSTPIFVAAGADFAGR